MTKAAPATLKRLICFPKKTTSAKNPMTTWEYVKGANRVAFSMKIALLYKIYAM